MNKKLVAEVDLRTRIFDKRVGGTQTRTTSKSETARLRMKMLVTVRIRGDRSTTHTTKLFPTTPTMRMRR